LLSEDVLELSEEKIFVQQRGVAMIRKKIA
jgi:hypothetical protein